MNYFPLSTVLVALALLTMSSCARSEERCPPPDDAALQVLGSGGPIADDGRASSSYIVWIDGAARAGRRGRRFVSALR